MLYLHWKLKVLVWENVARLPLYLFTYLRSSRQSCSVNKDVLKNFAKFTGKHLCQSITFDKVAGLQLYLKKTLAQLFSCEFCEILKNTFLQNASWRLFLYLLCKKCYELSRKRVKTSRKHLANKLQTTFFLALTFYFKSIFLHKRRK